ncbi:MULTISPECIES: hypothetical protein [unclassified Psychrobacillus]|uniref:hypothetical protein n=1 Tax=unclassified Psychrobacillus TaxID=2636677 RepID=UPI00146D885C|nr:MULTISPECIES: hypothetical protein [unclassified Psychrobacillus]MCM3358980.1 hypothetical protein [Psychrobacillus sp. MER TA 171]NME05139.1 hypothetical protein [Psychrobacillus sp. BL-248-WT-3]
MQSIDEQLNALKSGMIDQIHVTKEEFLAFREVLVKREDFKHFSGNAMQGGDIIYTYLTHPRS